MECGICYSYRLDSAIPDQVCNDPRCGQPFHQACLYEVNTLIYHSYTLLTHHYSSHTIFNEHKRLGRGCFSLTLSTEFILLSSQWLRGLPTSRQSFNIVFGECPYCSKVLMSYYFNSLVLGSLSLKQSYLTLVFCLLGQNGR